MSGLLRNEALPLHFNVDEFDEIMVSEKWFIPDGYGIKHLKLWSFGQMADTTFLSLQAVSPEFLLPVYYFPVTPAFYKILYFHTMGSETSTKTLLCVP